MSGVEARRREIAAVDYLVLGDRPHLVAQECTSCGARFFDRRNACAACSHQGFQGVEVPTEGTVDAYTIVEVAAPGPEVPFVAAIVDCGGTTVRANLVNVEPRPEHVSLGMPVRLTTIPFGTDAAGTTAVGFAFEPI